MADLKSLLERVEKATGPDRELDCDLLRLVPVDGIPQRYTASLDAALALVKERLPGWTRAVDATAPDLGIDVELFAPEGDKRKAKGTHDLEVHATLLALLRALISNGEQQ